MTTNWRENAGRILLDPNGPDGEPLSTPLDRRWLWKLEGALAVLATSDVLKSIGADLRQYLNETCQHHWRECPASGDIPAHRQCLWCSDAEFGTAEVPSG